jgi:hypothetical protein
MTKEVILDFVVTMLLAISLGIVLSIGGICLMNNYLGPDPVDKAEAHYPAAY